MRTSILIFPGFPGKVLCSEIPMAVLTPWEAMILLEKWTQTNSSQQAANCYSQIESSGKGLSRLWSNLMGKLYNYLLLELRRRETKIWTQLSAVYFHKNHCSSNLPCLEYPFHFGGETEFEVHQHTLKERNIFWIQNNHFWYFCYLQCFAGRENKYNEVLSTHLHKTQG